MDTRKYLLDIYRQFGHAPSIISSALTCTKRATCNSWLLGLPARMRGLFEIRQRRRLCRHYSCLLSAKWTVIGSVLLRRMGRPVKCMTYRV